MKNNPETQKRYYAKECRVIDRDTGQVVVTNHPSDFGLQATDHRWKQSQKTTRNDVKFWNRTMWPLVTGVGTSNSSGKGQPV